MLKQFVMAAALFVGGSALAQEVPKADLAIGSSWKTFRTSQPSGATRVVDYSVVRAEAVNGRNFLVVTLGNSEGWLAADTLSLGKVMRDGKPYQVFEPDWRDWNWPLSIGKTWVAEFRYFSEGRDMGMVLARWTVAARETITVPAGTFETLRLDREPIENSVHVETRWFAPSIGLIVKRVEWVKDQSGRTTEELVSFHLN